MTSIAYAATAVRSPASTSVWRLYRDVWRHAHGMRGQYALALALLACSQVIKLLIPWLAAQAIDAVQMAGADQFGKAALLTAAILAVYASVWALHGPGRVLERSVGLHVRASVADALYVRLAHLPLAWHESRHSGDVEQRAQQSSRALALFAENQFVYLQNVVNIVGPLVALYLVSAATGWIAFAGFVAIAVVIVRFDRRLMRLAEEINLGERRYGVRLLDFLGNVTTVLSLRLQHVSRRLIGARLAETFDAQRRSIRLTEAKWCAVDLLTVGLAWGLVAVYAWLSRRDTAGSAPLLLGSVFMVYQYAQQAGGVIGSMAANLQNFSRFKVDVASADPIWDAPLPRRATASAPSAWRDVAVSHLTFEYVRSDGRRGGVRDASLTLRRGERVALVGPSGGGKSTLLRLIAGLYEPARGAYRIDGAPQPGLSHLGSIATLIPQEAEIFEASLRDNVTFGTVVPPGTLERAAHASAFDAVVADMPEGWNTGISERGVNLSGGQRQRLALARGLLAARASSILLLDEPTSALDQATEARVFERLRETHPDACIVASIHRLSALEHFDRVVLMTDGCIVDAGPVADVIARQPTLRDMARATVQLMREQPEATPSAR